MENVPAAFDAPTPLTVGLEEEVFLLRPHDLDLAPRAAEVLAVVGGDGHYKLELPAGQLEMATAPAATVAAAAGQLADARRALVERTDGLVRFAGTGVHPFAAAVGVLNDGEHYRRMAAEFGDVARRQLVCALQVHVAIGSAAATLPVYNALRSYLPELAALAANAPFHEGRDTGLASVRPKIAELLPRQGIPPVLSGWDAYVGELRWGAATGQVPSPRAWWWELRPHPVHGTLEVRVCDTQATVRDSAALAAVVQCLVARLIERHAQGEDLPVATTWRIAENRWSANRHGVHGAMADLVTGAPEPTRLRLHRLLDDLGPAADRLGCAAELADAARLAGANGADRQRALAARHGLTGMLAQLADAFTAES
jgi:carboxylate-amine ligase